MHHFPILLITFNRNGLFSMYHMFTCFSYFVQTLCICFDSRKCVFKPGSPLCMLCKCLSGYVWTGLSTLVWKHDLCRKRSKSCAVNLCWFWTWYTFFVIRVPYIRLECNRCSKTAATKFYYLRWIFRVPMSSLTIQFLSSVISHHTVYILGRFVCKEHGIPMILICPYYNSLDINSCTKAAALRVVDWILRLNVHE